VGYMKEEVGVHTSGLTSLPPPPPPPLLLNHFTTQSNPPCSCPGIRMHRSITRMRRRRILQIQAPSSLTASRADLEPASAADKRQIQPPLIYAIRPVAYLLMSGRSAMDLTVPFARCGQTWSA
jgi:hypothetical protein